MEIELPPIGRRLLSPAELLAARTRDHKIPQRSLGQKDFIPDGSEEQKSKLHQCLEEHWQLLEEERVERLGSLVKAEWKPEEGIVELKSPAGKFWHTMGFSQHGKQCLLPEEALYLLECGSLQLFYRDLPLSIQEAYENLLSPKSVSLLKYQVFSHLKRLGYIVLRFYPSTLPTPYERQLNLDSHSQRTERGSHKRRRCSSPRLQDKKLKPCEDSLEWSPKAARRQHDNSSHLTSDGSSGARMKESDSNPENRQLVSPSGITKECTELSACVQEEKKMCSKGFWESHNDACRSRWNFASIVFPNMGADYPQLVLPAPDKRLLPENILARAVDASSWRKKLNQKRERLTRKEQEQLKWENRYKISVNEDDRVRRCTTWPEYKALLKERTEWKEKSHPAPLVQAAVAPLVKPDQGLSTADILQQISVFQPSHLLDEAFQLAWNLKKSGSLNEQQESYCVLMHDPKDFFRISCQGYTALPVVCQKHLRLLTHSSELKIDFDVYQADTASSFKKNNPGKPYVRMCIRRFDEQIPSLKSVKQLSYQSGIIPVVFALVDDGNITFFSFKEFRLPTDIYP